MAMSWFKRMQHKFRMARQQPPRRRLVPNLEELSERILPAVTAIFVPSAGLLTIFGDTGNNTIVISRDAAGRILVNGGVVAINGGTPTVANTAQLSVFGQSGNDTITLDEANGALPAASLFGGDGNDTLTGGSGTDLLFGQAGNDILLGKGGNDFLFGGAGDDTLTGGAGNDQVFGEAGNDLMIWNPGDATDLNEGGAGTDTVQVNGGNGAETFTVTPNGSRVRFDRITPAPFSIDICTSENLVVNMNGGDDTFVGSNGLAPLIALTVDGCAGNDTITGGDGNDRLIGGDGNDTITGGRGTDTALLGAGDDTFVWNPGDGSDIVEGQDGHDTLQFNGANIDEQFNLAANGSRLRLTRDVGAVTMDVNGTEQVNLSALGGKDALTVGDLTGTGVTQVNIDLGSPAGSDVGDGQADTVIVNGTNGNDVINVFGQGNSVAVLGLTAAVNISGSEGVNDALVINALGGDDGVTASSLPANVIKLTVDGGAGNDTILGSQGADTLLGGDGCDFIDGNQGNDTVFLGAGDDVFQWDPGDGSDSVEGQDGTDKMFFFSANIGENFDISANGSRVRFARDVGNVTMDLNGLERIELRTLGGADNVVVNDLTGTDLKHIELALRGPSGGVDGAADAITINGTQGDDAIAVGGNVGGLQVTGLAADIAIFDADPNLDWLTVNGLAGNDAINAQSLVAGAIQFTLNGGDGNDVITGSDGNDLINGGRGSDVAFMGPGDDTFVWNPGDGSDIVEGQAGQDTLQFNGANVNEKIDLSANGNRLRLARDVGLDVMDVNGTEQIDIVARGGADTLTVGDLTGTDVTQLDLDLSGAPPSSVGDGQTDTVVVSGTANNDNIVVTDDGTGVALQNLYAPIHIAGSEATDNLIVSAGAGDDVVQAATLPAGAIHLTADGGSGDDVLIGSAGNDTLLGGDGDDLLIGNGGQDVLDGGTGANVLIP